MKVCVNSPARKDDAAVSVMARSDRVMLIISTAFRKRFRKSYIRFGRCPSVEAKMVSCLRKAMLSENCLATHPGPAQMTLAGLERNADLSGTESAPPEEIRLEGKNPPFLPAVSPAFRRGPGGRKRNTAFAGGLLKSERFPGDVVGTDKVEKRSLICPSAWEIMAQRATSECCPMKSPIQPNHTGICGRPLS